MKYLKKIFEQEEQVQQEDQVQQEAQGSSHEELLSALSECIEKCNECVEDCRSNDRIECATSSEECVKYCELVKWSIENSSPNMLNLVEMCSEIARSCVEICSKEKLQSCTDACMRVALECEKVVDGE